MESEEARLSISINHAHVLCSPRPGQPHKQMLQRKEVIRSVVQSELCRELAPLHARVSLRVAQTKPQFDLFEGQRNARKLLKTHCFLVDFRNGVQTAISDAFSLRWHCPQQLDARPDQHGLRRIAPKHATTDFQADRRGWCELLVYLPVQGDSLPVAYDQVVPTEARKVKCGSCFYKDAS